MSEPEDTGTSQYPPTLVEALAVFQADPPKISKGAVAEVKNQQGKGLYSYSYADLAAVTAEVMPRLGAVGLAFTSRPTMIDGKLVLAYALVHVSGEREEGVYPLGAGGSPQQTGGLITYARRYCLCAVTGVAPMGDDDDAAGAEAAHRRISAGDVFEAATPARPRPRPEPDPDLWDRPLPGERNHATQPKPVNQGPREQAGPPPEPRTDDEWAADIEERIDRITDRDSGTAVYAAVVSGFKEGKCTAEDRQALLSLVSGRVSDALRKPAGKQDPS